jgi:hypothetical protein
MNMNHLLVTASALIMAGQLNSTAQPLYQLSFSGSSSTTDSSGRIVARPLNNQILIKDFGATHGVSDTSGFGLAYHVNGSSFGDTIDIVNRTNGSVVFSLFGLYFGESAALGRMELASASGRQIKRLEYIYTDQNSHSLGSVVLTSYYWLDGNGNTNNFAVVGNGMQYLVMPNSQYTNVQVATGSFQTTRPWKFGP